MKICTFFIALSSALVLTACAAQSEQPTQLGQYVQPELKEIYLRDPQNSPIALKYNSVDPEATLNLYNMQVNLLAEGYTPINKVQFSDLGHTGDCKVRVKVHHADINCFVLSGEHSMWRKGYSDISFEDVPNRLADSSGLIRTVRMGRTNLQD